MRHGTVRFSILDQLAERNPLVPKLAEAATIRRGDDHIVVDLESPEFGALRLATVGTSEVPIPEVNMAEEGPKLWRFLHESALIGDPAKARELARSMTLKVPCGECKAFWTQHVEANPPPTTSRDDLFAWTVAAHNAVNAKLGKLAVDLATARATWDTVDARREQERLKYVSLLGTRYASANHGKSASSLVQSWRPSFVADFGCGGNEFVRYLRSVGIDGVGIDFVFPEADVLAPMHKTGLPASLADVVTSFDAMEHLLPEDVAPVLDEMKRVARRRARFCFSISTVPSSWGEAKSLHPTVMPRSWWVEQIERVGTIESGRTSLVEGKQPVAGEKTGYLIGRFHA